MTTFTGGNDNTTTAHCQPLLSLTSCIITTLFCLQEKRGAAAAGGGGACGCGGGGVRQLHHGGQTATPVVGLARSLPPPGNPGHRDNLMPESGESTQVPVMRGLSVSAPPGSPAPSFPPPPTSPPSLSLVFKPAFVVKIFPQQTSSREEQAACCSSGPNHFKHFNV